MEYMNITTSQLRETSKQRLEMCALQIRICLRVSCSSTHDMSASNTWWNEVPFLL